ncbi:hypothetical protein HS041_10200 [Planomonospora sp. ID67723]|uniref:hypothetical protein n=1 Tax=Planomonospora sp. ID67723 TaxID=2738134 RepID=UPI0018C450B5|nr:hypothetical protein [Planomonospora sp. ID67723]MBG0828138.1 hypothetical protein [Planomonospora sp. ID67723]
MNDGSVEIELRLPRWAAIPSVRRHAFAIAALLVLAGGLGLTWWLLGRSYFAEDDIVFIGRAAEETFGWDDLSRVHIGHLMPGALALVRAITAVSAYDWTLVSIVILVLRAGAALALLRLLRLMFGTRPLILVPLAFFLFAPANFQAGTWLAAAINILPLQIAMLMALSSQVLLIRTGRWRHAFAGLGWTCAGLLFFEKAVVIPAVVFAFTVLLTAKERGVLGAVRRHSVLWLVHLALAGGYLVVYGLASGGGGIGRALPGLHRAMEYSAAFLGATVPTLLVGGPVTWGAETTAGPLVAPGVVEIVVAWTVLVAIVVVTCRRRPAAAWAWALGAGYLIVADGLLIMFGRPDSAHHAFESRYIADAIPLVAVCLALALMPWRGSRPGPEAGARAVSAFTVPAVCAYVALALVAATGFAQGLPGERNRAYFETARAELAALGRGVEVYPALVPDTMLFPWQAFENRLTSRALSPLAEGELRRRISRPGPAYRGVTFDEEGRLRPVRIFGGFVVPAERTDGGPRCFPLDRGGSVTFGLRAEHPGNVARINYRVREPVGVTVRTGALDTRLVLAPEHRQVFFPVPVHRGDLRVTVDPGAARPCLTAVALGAALPEEAPGKVSDGAG